MMMSRSELVVKPEQKGPVSRVVTAEDIARMPWPARQKHEARIAKQMAETPPETAAAILARLPIDPPLVIARRRRDLIEADRWLNGHGRTVTRPGGNGTEAVSA